jgi:endoglucanase
MEVVAGPAHRGGWMPAMSPLRVAPAGGRRRIVDQRGLPVMLRGVGVGGWMMLENFIDGFPGHERGLRAAAAEELGAAPAALLFDRLLDHVFAEADVAWIAGLGLNSVRLAVNCRQLEDDAAPFVPREEGYARLQRAVDWCAAHGVYAVIDLHAAPGGQNPDWHCDNDAGVPLLWRHPHFQDRVVAIWEELAARFAGNPAVAAYDVLNEPATAAHLPGAAPDWAALDGLQRRLVQAIRRVDAEHIVVLEGDGFASRFSGLSAPFDDQLVYSTHNYTLPCFGPGTYPGAVRGRPADRDSQLRSHRDLEGTRFCEQHGVPQWAGEMGAVFNGPRHEHGDRLRALDDELDILEDDGIGWCLWTYKDMGVMGALHVDPDSDYAQMLAPVLDAKARLGCDTWMAGWVAATPARVHTDAIAAEALAAAGLAPRHLGAAEEAVSRAALGGVAAGMLQPLWVRAFRGMSESRVDEVLSAWSLARCLPRQGVLDLLRRRTATPRAEAV